MGAMSRKRKLGEDDPSSASPAADIAAAAAAAATAAAATAAEAKAKAMEDQHWTCAVCLGLLFDPITSPCGHSLCWGCQAKVVRSATPDCPSCRAPSLDRDSTKWRVSSGLVGAMELNDGPAWRAAAPTLRLHAAFRDGKKDEATALLSGAAQLQLDRYARGVGEPLLHLALERKWDQACKELIRRGANVDERNSRGQPPLDCSSFVATDALLDAGAKVATEVALTRLTGYAIPFDDDRSSIIDETCMLVLALLPKPWQKQGPNLRVSLFQALQFGHKRTTLALLQEQVELSPALFASFPPLHFAAASADLEACKLLVARDGTALARRNVLNQTALHHAAAAGRHASVRLLRELGARAHDETDLQGCRMRNYAARWLGMGVGVGKAVWEELLAAAVEEAEPKV